MCSTSKLRSSANVGKEGTGRRVNGGSKENVATGAFVAEGLVPVGGLCWGGGGGDGVWHTEPTWRVL